MKQIEIAASYSGTISSGKYENEKPFFSLKETYDNVEDKDFAEKRLKELANICRGKFEEIEKRSQIEKLVKIREDLRFYDIGSLQYPSVTSIISWDKDFFIDPIDLKQYAARGTIIHKQVERFLLTQQWPNPKEIPEIYPEYVIVTKGALNLSLDDVDFRGFYEKYPFIASIHEQTVYNTEHLYAGRYDIKGKYNGKITIFDVKTTGSVNKTECMKQLSAYAHCEGNEDVEQLCLIHLNKKTKQGFSAPIIEENVEKYWHLFLDDRKKFKQRFGV